MGFSLGCGSVWDSNMEVYFVSAPENKKKKNKKKKQKKN